MSAKTPQKEKHPFFQNGYQTQAKFYSAVHLESKKRARLSKPSTTLTCAQP